MAQKFSLRPVLASEVPGGGLRLRGPGQPEGEKASRGVLNTPCALKPPNETLQEANDKLFSIPMTGDTVRNAGFFLWERNENGEFRVSEQFLLVAGYRQSHRL